MSVEMKEEVYKFCVKNAYEKCIYLYDLRKHKFSKPIYDDVTKESLEEYFISPNKFTG